MKSERLKKLIERYPKIWEKVCKNFEIEEARIKAFKAEIQAREARQLERRELQRKQRLKKDLKEQILTFTLKVIIQAEPVFVLAFLFLKHKEQSFIVKHSNQEIDCFPIAIKLIKEDFLGNLNKKTSLDLEAIYQDINSLLSFLYGIEDTKIMDEVFTKTAFLMGFQAGEIKDFLNSITTDDKESVNTVVKQAIEEVATLLEQGQDLLEDMTNPPARRNSY